MRGEALALAVAALTSCGPKQREPPDGPIVTYSSPCSEALARLAQRDFLLPPGILAGCKSSELASAFTTVGSPTRGLLGEPARDIELRRYQVRGWKQELRGWFERGSLNLIDTDYPEPAQGWRALVDSLGEPDARLDYAWSRFVLTGAERVYARRGLSLIVKEDPGLLLRIAFFAPTSVDTYAKELRFISREREEE